LQENEIISVPLHLNFEKSIKMKKVNIAIFASGGGTNCENIIRYFKDSDEVCTALVVSNKADAPVLGKALKLGVPVQIVTKAELNDETVMMPLLQQYAIDFIVLAGFLPLIPDFLVEAYPRRIVNIHPSLLPKFGGKGMWGHHVHEAVKAAGETETGMTVHWVTPVCDGGDIIAQYRVALSPEDSAEVISEKEHVLEMKYFPLVILRVLNETF
jgi:phosphoribosylglycinamide formyltransferase-1